MIRQTKWLLRFLAVFALFAAVACGGDDADEDGATTTPSAGVSPTARTEPVTLRLGYFANVTHAPALVGVKDGTFKQELGELVKLETKTFNAGPAVIEALFANEIDISYIGPNPAINGFVQSNGEALRIIGGSTSGGALLVVRPEAGITSAKDFANKKVATPQLGNTQDVALRAWLQENGLKAKEQGGNVTVLPTENATTLTLFQKGDIDAAWVPEPWATRLVQQAGGKIFLDEKSLWPNGQFVTTHIIVRTEFLKKYPDVVEKFLTANVKVIQAINADPEKAKTTTNDAIKEITQAALPREVIDASWKNLEFTWDPVASSLKTSADNAYALGFLGLKKPDLSKIYDLTILNRVLKTLNLSEAKGF
ncbi:MAG: ABC transporter substrate-binding protein [Dehalococcoidia bacterium]